MGITPSTYDDNSKVNLQEKTVYCSSQIKKQSDAIQMWIETTNNIQIEISILISEKNRDLYYISGETYKFFPLP